VFRNPLAGALNTAGRRADTLILERHFRDALQPHAYGFVIFIYHDIRRLPAYSARAGVRRCYVSLVICQSSFVIGMEQCIHQEGQATNEKGKNGITVYQ
jgi:hypothetical protein